MLHGTSNVTLPDKAIVAVVAATDLSCCCKRLKKGWSQPQADPAAPHKGLVSLRSVSGRANDTIYFCPQQRLERVPRGSGQGV